MDSSNNGLGFGLAFSLTDSTGPAAASIQNNLRGIDNAAETASRGIESSMNRIYAGFGQVAAGVGVLMPIKSVIDSFGEFDSLDRGMTVVMKSAAAAKDEIGRLREVAKLPGLGLKEAIEGSIQLQSVEMSAGMARDALLGFGNAISMIGGSRYQLQEVVAQLRQMISLQKVTMGDLKPITTRVPQLGPIMQKAFGSSSVEVINKMGISAKAFVEKVTKELLKLPKMTGGIKNGLENLEDSFWKMKVAIGKAIAPTVEYLANKLGDLLESIEAFAQTEFGATIIKIAASFLTLVGSTLIIKGLIAAFSGFIGLIGGYGAVFGGLGKVFNVIGMVLRFNITGIIGLLSKLKTAMVAFVVGNPITIALGVIAVAAYGAYRAYQTFTNFLEGKSGVLTGFMGIFQKIGGVLYGIGEIMGSVTNEGWTMSEGLYNALQKIGILDTVIAIGTWIVRLRAMWQGFGQAISESFAIVGKMFGKVKASLFKMLGPELTASITRLTSSLSIFKTIGYVIGSVFKVAIVIISSLIAAIVVLGGFIVKVGAMIIHAASWVVSGIMSMVGAIVNFVMDIPNMLGSVFSWLGDLAKSAFSIGVNFVNNLWEGIKSIWSKLTDWLTEKWNNVGKIFTFGGSGDNTDYSSTSGATDAMTGAQILQQSTTNRVIMQNANAAATYSMQPTVIDKSTQTVKSVNNIIQLDGRTIHQSVSDAADFDDARNGF